MSNREGRHEEAFGHRQSGVRLNEDALGRRPGGGCASDPWPPCSFAASRIGPPWSQDQEGLSCFYGESGPPQDALRALRGRGQGHLQGVQEGHRQGRDSAQEGARGPRGRTGEVAGASVSHGLGAVILARHSRHCRRRGYVHNHLVPKVGIADYDPSSHLAIGLVVSVRF